MPHQNKKKEVGMFDRKKYKREAYAKSKGLPKKMASVSLVVVLAVLFIQTALILPYYLIKYSNWKAEWFETVANSDGYFKGESDLYEFKTGEEINPDSYNKVGRYNEEGMLVVTKRQNFFDYATSSTSVPEFIIYTLFCFLASICVSAIGFTLSRYVYQWRKDGETSLSSFKNAFSPATLRAAAWYFLWKMIVLIPLIAVPVLVYKFIPPYTSRYASGVAEKLTLLTVAYFLYCIFACVKISGYLMTGYVLAENPKIGARRALWLSKKMSKGCRENILMMHILFVFWWIFTCLTLCFGFILFMPYLKNSFINAYESVKKNAIETGVLKEEDFDVLQ